MNRDEIDMVIYHAPCCDGFGSAYVVWRYYMETQNKREIQWIPANFGTQMPDVKDKTVLICDYSYSAAQMTRIMQSAKSVLIIDHHLSAQKELAAIPDANKIFNMNNSAAILVWQYFYPDVEAPMLLRYIEDRDIWKKKLPDSDAFIMWLFTQPFDFELYHTLATSHDAFTSGINTGLQYLEYDKFRTADIAKYATPKFLKFSNRDGEHYAMVSHICSNVLKSDIGNKLFYQQPYIDIAAVYTPSDTHNSTSISLRSTKFHMDVSHISKTYLGGGGHACASGGSIPAITSTISSTVFDSASYSVVSKGLYWSYVKLDDLTVVRIAYLNTTHHRVHIGKYLMQTKFTHGTRNVSEAVSILALQNTLAKNNQVNWEDGSEFLELYNAEIAVIKDFDAAAIWYMDAEFRSNFKIVFDKRTSLELRQAFATQILESDTPVMETDYVFKYTFNKLVYELSDIRR
jgi:oligoribonuclease NrnB/cAMP/cGMP phosphodiesterase (DHH superfamily)